MTPSASSSSASRTPAALACVYLLALACGSGDSENDSGSPGDSQTEMTLAPAMTSTPASDETRAASSTSPAAATPPATNMPSAPRAAAPAGDAETTPGNPASGGEPAAGGASQAAVFAACTYSEGSYGRNCDSVFVTMTQTSPARCVQLTFDNCGDYGRQGIGARVPVGWRLESGTVGTNPNECELGVFYPSSAIAQRAEGIVTWNETTRLPSELVLDISLDTAVIGAPAMTVELATDAPLAAPVCDR